MKLAFAAIIKGDDKEADLLKRLLTNVSPYMDGLFITATYVKDEKEAERVVDVAKLFGAKVSMFKWTKDFSAARNFNFSQVPKDFDYIMWGDADDMFRGLDKLRNTIEENMTVDIFVITYLYAFDEHKNPIVVHPKSQIVRNDGCVEWANSRLDRKSVV